MNGGRGRAGARGTVSKIDARGRVGGDRQGAAGGNRQDDGCGRGCRTKLRLRDADLAGLFGQGRVGCMEVRQRMGERGRLTEQQGQCE